MRYITWRFRMSIILRQHVIILLLVIGVGLIVGCRRDAPEGSPPDEAASFFFLLLAEEDPPEGIYKVSVRLGDKEATLSDMRALKSFQEWLQATALDPYSEVAREHTLRRKRIGRLRIQTDTFEETFPIFESSTMDRLFIIEVPATASLLYFDSRATEMMFLDAGKGNDL